MATVVICFVKVSGFATGPAVITPGFHRRRSKKSAASEPILSNEPSEGLKVLDESLN